MGFFHSMANKQQATNRTTSRAMPPRLIKHCKANQPEKKG
jgi:hypothetical protein